MSTKTFTIRHVWLALPLVVSFIALNVTPLKEGDLWWHIKLGEQIIALRQIPQADSFSFTAAGQAYFFSYSWLSDVVFYLLEKAGGLAALVLAQAVLGTCMAGLLLREQQKRGIPPALAATVTLICWVGLYPYSSARPQIFSFLLFALFAAVCQDYLQRGRNRLWLLPVLMLAWVNLHSGWVMGVILWLISLAGAILIRWWDADRSYTIKPLLGWGILAILILPLNPEGFGVYRSLVSAGYNPVNQQFVSEWQPLLITNVLSWAFFGLLALWVAGLAFTTRRPRLYEIGLMLVFAAFSLRYLRMPPFFYIVAAPIVAETLAGVEWQRLQARFARLLTAGSETTSQAGLLNAIILLLLGLGAIVSLPPLRLALAGQTDTSLISPYFPVNAVNTLKQSVPSNARVFVLAEWGGYLTWRLHPNALVFADGRAELFPPKVWDDYVTISSGSGNWAELLAQYQVDYLMLSKSQQAALILNAYQSGWACLAEDEVTIILSRQPATGACPSIVPTR